MNSLMTMRSALWTTLSWRVSSSQTALALKKLSKTTSKRKRRSEWIITNYISLLALIVFLLKDVLLLYRIIDTNQKFAEIKKEQPE